MPGHKAETEVNHIHQWVALRKHGAFRCITPYNGKRCIRVKVTEELYESINAEWNNYLELCQQSQAKADYEEARKHFTNFKNYKRQEDLEKLKAVIKRVEKRCWVNPDYKGMVDDQKYLFNEEEYMSKPDMPDPMSPKHIYITT